MNSETVPILGAMIVQSGLALGVFFTNPGRKSNQAFLLLSIAAVTWLAGLYFGLNASDLGLAAWWMRESYVGGILVLVTLNLLRITICERHVHWLPILYRARYWLAAAAAMILFCQTRFFLQGAHFVHHASGETPWPTYAPGYLKFIFAIYFAAAIIFLVINTWRDLGRTTGGEHAALSFLAVGGIFVIAFPLILSLVLRAFIEPSRLLWFAPFRVVLFTLVVAYGIATRKVIEVSVFLRRLLSYSVLVTYLLVLYGAVWWLVAKAISSAFHSNDHTIAHIAAALAITFAMAPARGFSQSLADKLFISNRGLDFRATVGKAAAILESITTLPDLLRRFATTIAEAVGTDSVVIYLAGKKGELHRSYPAPIENGTRTGDQLSLDDPLIGWLRSHREPLVLDELHRMRQTPQSASAGERLEHLRAAVALGIFTREHLVGVMLLGPRLSGRIYGSMEQDALQVLCGQLAVALDNAELFTEVQNAKIYNDILLENLTTGVVAADADGKITVFNQEAEQITGLSTDGVEPTIADLPSVLSEVFEETLASGERQQDREVSFRTRAGNVYVRASSSTFRGQNGELLGALMVFTDITALKKMEQQIRRSDRLASLGTLSAGMAHEIKNPLVSIKTFAQLLPERYNESDFRETFSTLIVHEIDRIDSLVNQLLRFARPAKPLLRPMHVHEILEKTLLLLQHRLYQKEIKLTRSWDAEIDTIKADSDQLEQVFLNFFLNAMDAMKTGGQLSVSTEIRSGDALVSQMSTNGDDTHEALRISIRDTGEGIKPEDIPHVFDPFFTTKDYGTGLGLSVVHGIIQEHGGQIEVESELAKGTAFHIFLPLVRFDQEVVAA